jgi:hypothetical protein
VICNGLDDAYSLQHVNASTGGSMSDHFGVYNFVNQSDPLDAWKPKDMADLINNIVRNPANADRTIQIKGWPGPLIGERMRLICGC